MYENGFRGCNFRHLKISSGEYAASGMIVSDSGHVVSPFQVAYLQTRLRVWTHPSARLECESVMSTVGLVRKAEPSVRFELIGARAVNVLSGILGNEFPLQPPGKIASYPTFSIVTRDSGRLVDMIMHESIDVKDCFSIWMKLVSSVCAIGTHDRHSLVSNMYGTRDFPYDFSSSKAGARDAALKAKSLLESHQKKPKQCRLDTSFVESTFFPDWNFVTKSGQIPSESDIQTVVVVPKCKGTVSINAHVYIDNLLVGFVTSANAVGDRKSIAVIKRSVVLDSLVNNKVEIQNCGSDHRYEACILKCRNSGCDSLLLGI
jgi:hypothetical protein